MVDSIISIIVMMGILAVPAFVGVVGALILHYLLRSGVNYAYMTRAEWEKLHPYKILIPTEVMQELAAAHHVFKEIDLKRDFGDEKNQLMALLKFIEKNRNLQRFMETAGLNSYCIHRFSETSLMSVYRNSTVRIYSYIQELEPGKFTYPTRGQANNLISTLSAQRLLDNMLEITSADYFTGWAYQEKMFLVTD